jgi:pyrimidine-nucleoside phosphorylase
VPGVIDFIERKRDGGKHSREDISMFTAGVRDGTTPDYQTAAWLMAAFIRGLDQDELAWFTEELAHSGDVVNLPGGGIAVDKHSTGGVGDKTTLIVAPLAAACGLRVAKLSGRGLGFTGGTVDKLESIPGMNLRLSTDDFSRLVDNIGIALSGHSLSLAPAEVKFYALRDVTGTVPSIPLIASSIVSKKIAGGAGAFVFDVKCGSGAFMKNARRAEALAGALVDLSASLGRASVGVISDMEQPLGRWVGNSLEVMEAVEVLSGGGPSDTRDLSIALAAEMLLLSGRAEDMISASKLAAARLADGSALEKFKQVVKSQGGDASVLDDPEHALPRSSGRAVISAREDGYVSRMDAGLVGAAARALGGGRMRHEDAIDPSVGLGIFKKIGDFVSKGETIIEVHYNDERKLDEALRPLESAYDIAESALPRRLILGRVTRETRGAAE